MICPIGTTASIPQNESALKRLSKVKCHVILKTIMADREAKRFDMFDKLEDFDQDNEPIITDDGQVSTEIYLLRLITNKCCRHTQIIKKLQQTCV